MDERVKIGDGILDGVLTDVESELGRRIGQHGDKSYIGIHEILGQATEEYDELKDAVHRDNPTDVRSELLDLAVVCLWGVASLDEIDARMRLSHERTSLIE